MTEDRASRPFASTAFAVSAPATTGEGADPSAVCFADEVVIDFPSVVPAVDRIRRGLALDEHARALPAVVSLTRQEARTGVIVPLDVPIRAICRSCGGRGESWTEGCGRCGSTGSELHAQTLQVTVPAGVVDGATFFFKVTPRHQPSTRVELRIRVR